MRSRLRISLIPLICLVAAMAVGVAACGDDDGDDDVTSPQASEASVASTTSGAPTSEPPATAPGPPAIELVPVADVDGPSGLIDLPGPGPVLVSTLGGQVLSLDPDGGGFEVVLDLAEVVSTGGERGLLDIATDADGERFYVDYTNLDGHNEIRSWPLADGRPSGTVDESVLHLTLDQPFPNHNGGNLEFGPDGALWIGTGDGGSSGDPDGRAQDPTDLLGKMLRVIPDPDGGVLAPEDNPEAGGRSEIWAIGLRNPWRYSFDPETGLLWIADVGQNAVEEVSVVDPGVEVGSSYPNFGWPLVEGDQPFDGSPSDDLIAPVITYRHADTGGCSVTGGHVYRGEAVESLIGWYVFGDYCGGWLWAVPADDATSEPVELATDVGGVISIEVLDDGELLVFSTAGGILRIVAG